MTKSPTKGTTKRTNDATGLPDHFKVRIWLKGSGVMHILSRSEPVVAANDNKVITVDMDVITGADHGDTIGFIDWSEVAAVSWRFCVSKITVDADAARLNTEIPY